MNLKIYRKKLELENFIKATKTIEDIFSSIVVMLFLVFFGIVIGILI